MNTNEDFEFAQEMYREQIMDHFKNPRNSGTLNNSTISHKELNPLCGDEIKIMLYIKKNEIKKIRFKGTGCAISQAAPSMLTERVKGKQLSEVKKLKKEDVLKLLSIPIGPVRMKCALLSLDTLKNSIKIYKKYRKGEK